MNSLARQIAKLTDSGQEFALCTIVNTKGSSPRKVGAKMIVLADGKISGTIGGGELEKKAISDAMLALQKKTPLLCRYDLLHQLNMCCGGSVEIFIEPVMKKEKLYIFGAGHVGHALANYAVDFDFDVFLIDDRKEMFSESTSGSINKMNLSAALALPVLPFDEETYTCIMTYSHSLDRDILAFCINKPFAYLGMIGSRRKTEITKKIFCETGIGTEEELARVDMPMGIDIHAEGPYEIALSIMARLVEVRNRKRGSCILVHSKTA